MEQPGLYIHVPFCRGKCPYCAFFSVPSRSLVARWIEALKKEVVLYKGWSRAFDTLYFGGGSPSLLETGELAAIMDHLCTHHNFEPDAEITLEANPCDLTWDKIRAIKAMGFNRISLGVQSLDDRTLGFLGRRHTALAAERAFWDLRQGGFENISIDLIYGSCGEGLKQWLETLKRAVLLQSEHISCYLLSIEKRTRFHRLMDQGVLKPLSEEEEHCWFHATSRFLEKAGYIHYEVSSFARQEALYSRHNTKYWNHSPYLGLGPSAHSFHETRRWWNVSSVRAYCAALERGLEPVEDTETLSREQLKFESIFLGLRTRNGFHQDKMSGDLSGEALGLFREKGFVSLSGGRVLPTRKGLLVADYLACCLGQ
jgi:oxygen-independent coproporphyrinogen III oxidase